MSFSYIMKIANLNKCRMSLSTARDCFPFKKKYNTIDWA